MTSKKTYCCVPARICTLLFSCLFLVYSLWSLLSMLMDSKNPIYKKFWEHNSYIFFADIFFNSFGILFFFLTIVSITANKPCICLLDVDIVFLLLTVIYIIYCMFPFAGVIDNLIDVEIDAEVRSLRVPLYAQDQYRNALKNRLHYAAQSTKEPLYIYMVTKICIVLYSIMVFYGYKTKLKKKLIDGASVQKNVDKEANICEPSFDNLQPTAPPDSTQIPQYIVECNKKYKEPINACPITMV